MSARHQEADEEVRGPGAPSRLRAAEPLPEVLLGPGRDHLNYIHEKFLQEGVFCKTFIRHTAVRKLYFLELT